jgi:hypothetical protein
MQIVEIRERMKNHLEINGLVNMEVTNASKNAETPQVFVLTALSHAHAVNHALESLILEHLHFAFCIQRIVRVGKEACGLFSHAFPTLYLQKLTLFQQEMKIEREKIAKRSEFLRINQL